MTIEDTQSNFKIVPVIYECKNYGILHRLSFFFYILSHAWKHGFLDARHYANLPYLNQNGKTLNNALHSEVEIDVK